MTNINELAYSSSGTGVTTLESIEGAVLYNEWVSSRFLPWMGEKNLELGAGTGTISAVVSKYRKIELTEVSPDCLEKLRERFRLNDRVTVLDVDYFEVNEEYDSIYSSNVLEHVEDDYRYFKHAEKALKRGGYFIATVPGHEFLMSDFDRKIGHFRRYNIEQIYELDWRLKQDESSLRLVGARHYNPVGAIGWLIKMKLLKQPHIKMADIKMMECLVPYLSKLDCINFGFGQNLFFVFQKM